MTDNDSEYGPQSDGTFRRKHVDEARADAIRRFKNTAGEEIEFRQSSPQQALIDMHAQEAAVLWQALEGVYFSSFFEDSQGEQLDKQLALAGFSRRPSRSATGEVEFSRDDPADDDIDIPEGTVVTTERSDVRPAIPFETTEDVILSAGDTEVTAAIEGLKPWQTDLGEEWLGEETNVAAGSITRFADPVAGVDGVTNPLPTGDTAEGFTEGRDEETDPAFKLRYQNTLAEGGVSTPKAIESSVFRFDEDIRSVRVEEVRDTDEGFGPEVTVFAPGVNDDVIAQAVHESRAAGLDSFGDETGTAEKDDGRTETEFFERASEVTIYVDIDLTTSSTYPSDGDTRIENNIIRFVGGVANDDIQYPGLEIGDDVIYDQIKKRVMEVRGVISADVFVGTSEDPTETEDISVGDLEVAMSGLDEIQITEE